MKDLRKKQRGSFESENPDFAPPSGKSPKQWGRSKGLRPCRQGNEGGPRVPAMAVLMNLPFDRTSFARLQPSSERARQRLLKRCPAETAQCLSVPWLLQRHNQLAIAWL